MKPEEVCKLTFRQFELLSMAREERRFNEFVEKARLQGAQLQPIEPPLDEEEVKVEREGDEVVRQRAELAMARRAAKMRDHGKRPNHNDRREGG